MRALRRCVLHSLSQRWAWGPPSPAVVGPLGGLVGAPWEVPGGLHAGLSTPNKGPPQGAPPSWGALKWAQQQKELFPSGYQVLLEERASCAAANIWNAMQDAEERLNAMGPQGGPSAPGAPVVGAPRQEETHDMQGHPEEPRTGLIFCSTALLPLVIESLQQLHALEAPKAAAVAAAAAATGEQGPRYRTNLYAALHRSPPCLVPLLLLRFLLLPVAAAYGIAAAAAAFSSWAHSSLHRGDPPAAIAGELHVPINGDPTRGPHRGASEWEPFRGAPEWGASPSHS